MVGGGAVGTRKVNTLISCGAKVTVVSPELDSRLIVLADTNRIAVKKRLYLPTDLDNMFLVISATSDQKLNQQISTDAQERNMLCNIADFPEACNFILPAIVRRGDLVIAISTSGKSPAFAKQLRKEMEKQFGEEYSGFLMLMGAIRKKLLNEKHEPEAHKHIFQELIAQNILEMIQYDKKEEIDTVLNKILGPGFSYDLLLNSK